MHQFKTVSALLLLIFMLASCASEGKADRSMSSPSFENSTGDASSGRSVSVSKNANQVNVQDAMRQGLVSDSKFKVYDHKIIKTTRLTIEVEDYRKSLLEIQSLVDLHGAYVAKESQNFARNEIQGNTIEIRVPTEEFNDLLNGIEQSSKKIISKELKAEDVGQEFVDIEARIRSKKSVAQRYEQLLRKSGSVEELLVVEEKLRHIREEIEAKEGRLRYLQNRVSYGTIVLTVKQHRETAIVSVDKNKYTFDDDLKDAFFFGWSGLKTLLLVIAHLWPFWFIGLPLAFFIHRFFLRRRPERKLYQEAQAVQQNRK